MKRSVVITLAVVFVASLVTYAWACGVGTVGHGDESHHAAGAPHGDESHHVAGAPHGDESHHGTTEPVQMIEEAKAQEAAEAFVAKYLSGYTIDKIEKDEAHAAYLVTVKGGNGAELQVVVNGVSGQVTYIVVPTPAE